MVCIRHLTISAFGFVKLLPEVPWLNAVYKPLARVDYFYSNMTSKII